jgi:hypothetical protein
MGLLSLAFGTVMAGHSRSKNGVVSLAYVPAIHVFLFANSVKTWMPATSAGMTHGACGAVRHLIASGLTGEPTAPVIGIAGATNMNS